MTPLKQNGAGPGLQDRSWRPSRTAVLRLLLVTSLLTAAVVCAVLTYNRLTSTEKEVGEYAYESIAASALNGAKAITERKVQGSEVMATLISHALPDASQWPLIDVPGYFEISGKVAALSSSTTQSLMVFLKPEQVEEFEAHTQAMYQQMGQPEGAGVQDFGFGIWRNDPVTQTRVHDTSGNTTWGGTAGLLTPLMIHNQPGARSLLYNVYSEERRGIQLDSMLECVENHSDPTVRPSCAVITNMLELQVRPGPAGLLFQPIFPANDLNTLVGFATTSIHWQEVLENVVPDYVKGLVCVVSTDTDSYTYEIRNGKPELVGDGDEHDTRYESLGRSVVLNDFIQTGASTSAVYTLTVYPTPDALDIFTATNPLAVALGFCGVMCFCICMFFVYDHLMRYEAQQRKNILDMKRRFVRFISHEIRTPLNTVCMGLDLLESEVNPIGRKQSKQGKASCGDLLPSRDTCEDNLEFWHSVIVDAQENSTIAVSILNDLLDYDKLETGTLKVEMEQVCIWDLVQKTTRQFKIQAINRRVDLSVEFSQPDAQEGEDVEATKSMDWESSLQAFGDPMKLSQVIRNLLSNALKFTPEGGTIKVVSTYHKDGLPQVKGPIIMKKAVENAEEKKESSAVWNFPRAGSIKISVIDSGVGLSKEQLKMLFSEGVQFDANKLQHGGGSGLGLNIAKGIVEQHGGTIAAESEGVNKGTTFTIELPLFEFHQNDMDKEEKPNGSLGSKVSSKTCSILADTTETSDDINPPSRQILVVEDSDSSRKMLIRLLERTGHSCIGVANGQQAIDAVKHDMEALEINPSHNRIDTILMDFEMPLKRGPEATREIRQLGFIGTVLGVTGNLLSEDIEFFLESGADEVLAKPISMDRLRSCWVRHPLESQGRSTGSTIRRNKWSFSHPKMDD